MMLNGNLKSWICIQLTELRLALIILAQIVDLQTYTCVRLVHFDCELVLDMLNG